MGASLNVDDLVKEHRVHRKIYTETEVFETEIERIFERTWVFVGHDSEIPKTGDFKTVPIGLQPAIMVRDEDGAVQVVMNRCMHRGATVCQESRGNVNAFRCWYHGWTYNHRGDLIGIPYANGYGKNFDRGKFHLVRPKVGIYRGLVFASLNPDVPEIGEHLGRARQYIDLYMDLSPTGEVEARAGTHKYGYDGNWKFQMENGVDGYHPNFVHQAYFEVQGKASGPGLMRMFSEASNYESRDLGSGHSLLDMAPKRKANRPVNLILRGATSPAIHDSYVQSLVQRYGEERTEQILLASNVNLAVFPNLLIIGIQFRHVIPVGVSRTDVHLLPTTLKGVPDEINVARLRAHESFYGSAGGGAPDDVEMFNRCTKGLQVKGAEWLELSRGVGRERIADDGSIVAHITDELPQRAFYRQWRELMLGATSVVTQLRPAAHA